MVAGHAVADESAEVALEEGEGFAVGGHARAGEGEVVDEQGLAAHEGVGGIGGRAAYGDGYGAVEGYVGVFVAVEVGDGDDGAVFGGHDAQLAGGRLDGLGVVDGIERIRRQDEGDVVRVGGIVAGIERDGLGGGDVDAGVHNLVGGGYMGNFVGEVETQVVGGEQQGGVPRYVGVLDVDGGAGCAGDHEREEAVAGVADIVEVGEPEVGALGRLRVALGRGGGLSAQQEQQQPHPQTGGAEAARVAWMVLAGHRDSVFRLQRYEKNRIAGHIGDIFL